MILSPVFVRLLEREGYERLAGVLAYIGYTWMAFVFLFFCTSILTDIGEALYLLTLKRHFAVIPNAGFLVPFIVSAVLVGYGFFEAKDLRMKRVLIETERLPKDMESFRIVHITDLHVGIMTSEKDVKLYVEKIKALRPDVLVSTGDLVDGQLDQIDDLLRHFVSLNPSFGKFAVTGNHEYYAGIEKAKKFLEKSGFRVLRNEIFRIKNGINIVGIDDSFSYEGMELALLRTLKTEEFTILLKHRPVVVEECVGLFDLQLSGHTHGGQIFPFKLITRIFFKHISGHKILNSRSHLYVSRGAGTWGPPVRLFSPPEVTLIEVLKKNF